MIDELFRRAKKYAMLEEDLQAAASPVLVSTQVAQTKKDTGNKRQGSGNPSQGKKPFRGGEGQRPPQRWTSLNLTYR